MGIANTQTNQYIKNLIASGADAMKNLYYLEFQGGLIENISQSMKVRCTDFNPPTATHGVHKVSYLTVDADLPSSDISIDKTIQFSFRLDENYTLYKYLLAQQATTFNGNTGWAINRVPDNKDKSNGLTIKAYIYDRTLGDDIDEESNYRNMYTFKYCYITSITGLQFSQENSSPMKISVTVKFFDYEDPMNTLL